ncbi:motility protein A [Caproiciproducens galactitolivorans]|uniref:MotA/TolQ/ExbB proton channel family protein n=1 Tax=Caproiciproducens galactitolivorans TaxID=642589 RepID=A0ABT4BPF8_9FIRM|nr:MotA/TolQ/ExbB proton channel family protein [Caproiciproducens galactitolivorans]MCY1712775.1 MotA/TolQ/ExbB proton channel family protein [Caproiciproducens galactitolivorans]
MDISVILGIVISFGSILLGYTIEKGTISSLILLSPILIVFGGTAGATILSYNLPDLIASFKAVVGTFSNKSAGNPTEVITKITGMADTCRQGGILKLQELINDPDLDKDEYTVLKEGMVLALDMKNADEIQEALESNLSTFNAKKQIEASVWVSAAGYSPTMGVIGTVMGLVQVLSHMTDAEQLVASIGVAFIATLYGVVFANLIYMPFANRLKNTLKRQMIIRQMMVEGICMIARGEASRSIENKLSAFYQVFPKGDKLYKEGIQK